MENHGPVYATITVFALLVLAGFYLTFDKISTLQTSVKNMELALSAEKKAEEPVPETPADAAPSLPASTTAPVSQNIEIPASILFSADSSSSLVPQAKVTVTVENAVQYPDHSVRFFVKVFTSDATSYTALDMGSLIQLIDTEGNKTMNSEITGSFASMPPKSSVTGTVLFKIPADRSTVILQAGEEDTAKYYEFDFGKKLYRETILG